MPKKSTCQHKTWRRKTRLWNNMQMNTKEFGNQNNKFIITLFPNLSDFCDQTTLVHINKILKIVSRSGKSYGRYY